MGDSAGKHGYRNETWWWHLVAEYTNLTFKEIMQLDYYIYLSWRRDAYITYLEQTESGREYLENAWRMEQTTPDRKALRAKLGHKEVGTDGR